MRATGIIAGARCSYRVVLILNEAMRGMNRIVKYRLFVSRVVLLLDFLLEPLYGPISILDSIF